MIEPLRYHIEKYPPYAIPHPIFCQRCLSNRKTRDNPKLVIKYCDECPRCQFLCKECDEYAHSFVKTKDHIRRIVVVGPAVRKKIHQRGDSRSFPQLFDVVEIKFKAKVVHNGKVIHRSKPHHMAYPTGISGQCVHVQILGAKKLPIADAHGSSDPFICVSYGGKRIGTTRTRPRTINPRWSNETYILPIGTILSSEDEQHQHHHQRPHHKKSQDLIKFEVFDRDYFNFNDFLGHVEITRQQLAKLANLSNQKPIRLSLGLREYHGRLGIQFGINADLCYLKILKAESLDKMDAIGLSDPFCEIYFKNKFIGRTNVCSNTLDPVWTSGNLFTFAVEAVLKEEIRLRALARLGHTHRLTTKSTKILENSSSLFRIELFDYNSFRPHAPLGTIHLSCDSFRRLAPTFPRSLTEIEKGKSINHLLFSVRNVTPTFVGRRRRRGGGGGHDDRFGNNDDQQEQFEGTSPTSGEKNNSQLSDSFKTKLEEIEKLDHIDEESLLSEENVDPSIADEDQEIPFQEPKEPSLEFENNIPFNDDDPQEGGEGEGEEGGGGDEEESLISTARRSQVPFLNLSRSRDSQPSEHEPVDVTIEGEGEEKDGEEEEDEEDEEETVEEKDPLSPGAEIISESIPAIYRRTGRAVTPRVTHNLPSYDEEEDGKSKNYTRDQSSNQVVPTVLHSFLHSIWFLVGRRWGNGRGRGRSRRTNSTGPS
jgi:hypothetical protein